LAEEARTRAGRTRSGEPRFDVVGFGALNMDHLYAVPHLIQDGGVEVLASTVQPGGSAANTIYGLAKLGLRCGFVGVVGDDDAGKAILQSFKRAGVDTGGILVRPAVETGQTICITAGQAQKAIYIIPGANSSLSSEDVDVSYLSDAGHVHLSSFVGESAFAQQLRAVERLPAQVGVSLALDAVYARRGLDGLSALIERCTLLIANADELQELTGRDLRASARACLDTGCEIVVATFGSGRALPGGTAASMIVARPPTGRRRGAVEHVVPAVKTHDGAVVDTTGAGDAFATGFLFGLLEGRTLPVCGALGHTAAGFCLAEMGARAGLPNRQDLLTRFNDKFRLLFAQEAG